MRSVQTPPYHHNAEVFQDLLLGRKRAGIVGAHATTIGLLLLFFFRTAGRCKVAVLVIDYYVQQMRDGKEI